MLNQTTITNTTSTTESLFPLGRLFMTPGAIEALEEAGQSPQEFISRHSRLDKGELGNEDYKENLFSVDKHLRILVLLRPRKV